jgi:hypothetical protein
VSIPIHQVDAFTDKPFRGNPAAVCLLQDPADEDWMRAVAREMNLSETSFLYRDGGGFNLRWFTPAVEVDLCGHAHWRPPTFFGKRASWAGTSGRSFTHATAFSRPGFKEGGIGSGWIFPPRPSAR